MARGKKHTAEQVVNLLRQVEVGVTNGKLMAQACKEAGIVERMYYFGAILLLVLTKLAQHDNHRPFWARRGVVAVAETLFNRADVEQSLCH